jgi:hypothetical protein
LTLPSFFSGWQMKERADRQAIAQASDGLNGRKQASSHT